MNAADDRHRRSIEGVPLARADVIWLVALLALAWWLYRPEMMRAIDYVDFPENIFLLKGQGGFVDRFLALSQAYREHGRWHPVSSAVLVAQWSVFESWTPGWHLVRYAILSTVTSLSYVLYRRIGLNSVGAATGALLFVIAPPAINGWTRLSTGEPLGALFLLIACLIALDLRRRRAQWILALMVGAVVWSKEIMATALVLPLLLALTAGPYGDLSFARVGLARFRRLAPAAIALIAAIIPVLAVVASTAPDSFARRYAATELSLVGIIGSSLMAWLPIIPTPGDIGPVVLIGVAMLLIAAGWLTVWRQRERRAHHAVVLVAALGMPVIGAIAYAPWPFYIVIYALPFLSGGALLLGQAVSGLSASGRLDRAIAAFCLVPIATFASLTAANASDRAVALHGAIATSVQRVAEAASIESVLVAVAEDQYDPRGNFGPRFPLYARMIGVEWPPVRDVTCEEARGSARRGILVLTLSEMCPGEMPGDTMIVFKYSRYDWPDPIPHPDSVTVALTGLFISDQR